MRISRKLSVVLLSGVLLICTLMGWSARLRSEEPPPDRAGADAAQASILAVPVRSFEIDHAGMAEAVWKLRGSDASRIVIGFERLPHRNGENGGPISLALTDLRLADVVHRLCQADPRYEYEVIKGSLLDKGLEGSMIEIRPKGAPEDPNDLLNIRVRQYIVDAPIEAWQAVEHIGQDVPEVSEFLYRKEVEWAETMGKHPGGTPGSIISGNMPPPRFTLELHDVTVCQILDALSLKSIQRFKEGKNYGPASWEYEFLLDPTAPTGLGGRPQWKAF